MAKQQWLSFYQSMRLYRSGLRVGSNTTHTLNRLFREVYGTVYYPHQVIYIRLVHRYKTKLSRTSAAKKLAEIRSWRPEARQRGRDLMRTLVCAENPFLRLLPKNDGFAGKYISVPIIFGDEE